MEVALAGTAEGPAATATAVLLDEPSGVSITLDVGGLEPASDDTFYEAWLVGESGKASAGTFHLRGAQDDIELWLVP
jgi:Anti-sigma-K factor rskA